MQSVECWQKAMMVLIIASSMVLRIRLGFPVKRYFQTPEIDIIVISDDDWWMNYPGGKGKCYQRLINLMPAHQVYIDPPRRWGSDASQETGESEHWRRH